MMFFNLCLWAIGMLLTWLMTHKDERLSETDKHKLNHLLFKCAELEQEAIAAGCVKGGRENKEVEALCAKL